MENTIINPLKSYSKQLVLVLKKAEASKNPALYLFKNDARTPLFMAESITRILMSLSVNPIFETWHKTFKKLEDTLGEVDHYDAAIKQFSANKLFNKEQINYLEKKRDKILNKLNEKLVKKKFYLSVFNQINLSEELNLNQKIIIAEIKKHIETELQNATGVFNKYAKGFTDMELQVHELRRKLRWISIYARSLNGIIVLKNIITKYPWEKQLITATEKTSPYNKLPINNNVDEYIYFNKKAFYALSNIIKTLGVIKDKGLTTLLAQKLIKKTNPQQVNDTQQTNVEEERLLHQAHQLLYLYFKQYKIHKDLIL